MTATKATRVLFVGRGRGAVLRVIAHRRAPGEDRWDAKRCVNCNHPLDIDSVTLKMIDANDRHALSCVDCTPNNPKRP
jgi:hypothetical protein